MAKAHVSDAPCRNALLANLPPAHLSTVLRSLQPVEFKVREVIYEPHHPIDYAYFPENGMISVVSLMSNGDSIEVGTIGREGMAGSMVLLETDATAARYFVQVEGHGYRVDTVTLKELAEQIPPLRRLIMRYQAAYLSHSMQSTACNGLHTVQQRCCRWLLMARDRSESDNLSLTHEFLALMLGVRRASVSDVLRPLQDAGLINSNRGRITILNRGGLEKGSCECYRAIMDELQRMLK